MSLYERDSRVIAGVEKLRFFPAEIVRGQGARLTDTAGRQVIDLTATWTAVGVGYAHPKVVEAVSTAVANQGYMGLSMTNPTAVELAEQLLAVTPGAENRRVYLGHSGSDACDVALRCARHATGKRRIIAFEHSYHGGFGTAMAVSGVHVEGGSVERDPDSTFVPYPNPYRPGIAGIDSAVHASLSAIEAAIAAGDVACLIVEPILSDGGLIVPPDGYLTRVVDLAHAQGVLVICDEVKVGLGRPGTLHAFQHDGAVPDVVCWGKTLGAGIPLSAAAGPAALFDGPSASALLTTAGNPVSAAAGLAVLGILRDEDLPGRAARVGEHFRGLLRAVQTGHGVAGGRAADHVGDVRGRGLAIGLELVTDQASRTPDPTLAAKVSLRAWQLGASVFVVGHSVLEITPPLVISEADIQTAAEIIDQAIVDVQDGRISDDEVSAFAGW